MQTRGAFEVGVDRNGVEPDDPDTNFFEHGIASLALMAILVVGCTSQLAPAPANERVTDRDDEIGSVVANVWYAPGRALPMRFGRDAVRLGYDLDLGTILRDMRGLRLSITAFMRSQNE
jgi:hypothetical protein